MIAIAKSAVARTAINARDLIISDMFTLKHKKITSVFALRANTVVIASLESTNIDKNIIVVSFRGRRYSPERKINNIFYSLINKTLQFRKKKK